MPTPLPDDLQSVVMLVVQFDATRLDPALLGPFQAAAAAASLADRLGGIAELLYANLATVDDAAKTLAAQCAHVMRLSSIGALADPRGAGVEFALRRELGETAPDGMTWPAQADDPTPTLDPIA